jgi:hypothetical protein
MTQNSYHILYGKTLLILKKKCCFDGIVHVNWFIEKYLLRHNYKLEVLGTHINKK